MTVSPRVRPDLWFDGQAREAAEFYVSVFSQFEGPERFRNRDRPGHGRRDSGVRD